VGLPISITFGTSTPPPVPMPQLWMVKHDLFLPRGVRTPPEGLRGCPEIFRFTPQHSIEMTEGCQKLWKAINPRMTGLEWKKLLGNNYAFCNGHGYFEETPLRDYVNRLDLNAGENPRMPYCYVMGGAILAEKKVVDGCLYPEYIDVNQPLPSAEYVLARPWLSYVVVNVYSPSGSVGGVPASIYDERVPLFARMPICFPISSYDRALVKLDMSKPLPGPYLVA